MKKLMLMCLSLMVLGACAEHDEQAVRKRKAKSVGQAKVDKTVAPEEAVSVALFDKQFSIPRGVLKLVDPANPTQLVTLTAKEFEDHNLFAPVQMSAHNSAQTITFKAYAKCVEKEKVQCELLVAHVRTTEYHVEENPPKDPTTSEAVLYFERTGGQPEMKLVHSEQLDSLESGIQAITQLRAEQKLSAAAAGTESDYVVPSWWQRLLE